MVRNNYKFSKTRKSLIAALCAVSVTCTGLAAACSNTDDGDDETDSFSRNDTVQVLSNGNFENYSVPADAVYLIKNTLSWSRGGDSSNAMSGIIGTSDKAWAALTEEGLSDKLDYNNDLKENDSNYDDEHVDYNGMQTRDILYRDTYSALLNTEDVADSYIKKQGYEAYFGITYEGGVHKFNGEKVVKNPDDESDIEYYFENSDGTLGKSVRYSLIDNPGTHYDVQGNAEDGYYFDGEDGRVDVYVDEETGDYFYYIDGDSTNDKDENKAFISNVLMVHNYPTNSTYNGIQQYYASQSVTLEANTAAEISLWVKTAELRFDQGYSQANFQDRGAFIEVTQTVNGSAVSSFKIKSINTEKIIADGKNGTISLDSEVESNGWLRYTVYVNACDFGDSTITLNLGLGQAAENTNDYSEKCTGYAFFDDVTVTKFRDLDNEKCTYNTNKTKITDSTTCTLATDDDEKIKFADRAVSNTNMAHYSDRKRDSENFYYLVDLASEKGNVDDTYHSVNFAETNTTAKFTTEKVTSHGTSKNYSSADVFGGTTTGLTGGFTGTYVKPENLAKFRSTENDLIGAYTVNKNFTFTGDWASLLNDDLLGENGLSGLPKYDEDGTDPNLLLMLSQYGAAYTTTISDNAKFSVDAGKHMIVSFWVKTSDMDGKTAATVKITDGTKDNVQTITVDSTGKTTDFGKDEKDIYNGWVQCFFFVKNDTEQDNKTFKIEFSFGNTAIADTTVNSYKGGWVALANMQTLSFDNEDIYSLTSDGDYAKQFTFTEEDNDDTDTPFDEPSGTSDIKKEIASPANYSGVNGGSSSVSENGYKEGYDAKNTNSYAGLINKNDIEKFKDNTYIYAAFNGSNWIDVFERDGNICYQPLVIINTLRAYADNATANENTYTDYYIEIASATADSVTTSDDRHFRKATETDIYDPDETYYSLGANYGFMGADNSIAADSYQTVSVKVMVSEGAVAYVYLVDGSTREVLGYSTPSHSFYYDDEGNVLSEKFDTDWTDSEHKTRVVYTLLDNGLYKDKNGVIRANLYNLTKAYKYYEFQNDLFYTDDTASEESRISFTKLVDGETYYDENGNEVDHYLVNSDGKSVYKFVDGKYYYIVNGNVSSQAVENFEEKYARKDAAIDEKYFVKVEDTQGKWVTVNFFVHTGSEAKEYRLELWSGSRDEAGDLTAATGGVAFDISNVSITEEDAFNSARSFYETELINEYKALLAGHDELLKNENIAYYEAEIAKIEDSDIQSKFEAIKAKYTARYYSYTLYDDGSYIPFNAETAEDGETGYDYKITDEEYGEKLAFLKYEGESSYNVFIDYSAVDQDVELGTVSDDDESDEEAAETDWLIITSIILVVALLFTLISIIVRDLIKKLRKKQSVKSQSKNMYRKRERYIKKLHLVKNEEVTEDADASEAEPVDEAAAQTEPVEEPAEAETEPAEATEEKPSDEE